ncbi:hypothetical protein [Solitalea canadensis]|uniref:Uncharacterized protein n=1 Tax=Solitalea canadensis (strain ATCC 29591 / DSM 3403 / JCM 21819 / LMG 8368 / NBRC 15130 / NCIMB 12057 / USAM 9D) TaxID=929556 RepID=H8KV60_SOLCM|nr:hypothetical protein [Solitalea canadensis]AFD06060.1 hypothetical protein Solca_0948 [Solitalea canadensis DSM 3403]
MTSYLAPALTVDELGRLFSDRRFVNSNYEFHKRLLNEFANFLYFQKKESYTTAFIYIYRVLEMISIPFPLIYASKIEDFNSAFQFLKACTSDELTKENSKGELGVFRVFLRKLFENDPMKDLNINISIDPNFPNEVQKTYYKVLERMCGDILDKSNCQEFDTLSVKFIELNTLIINIRNRFFHLFSANRHNIQSDEIPNTDQFFKLINNHLASWIALIYFEVVKFSISKR